MVYTNEEIQKLQNQLESFRKFSENNKLAGEKLLNNLLMILSQKPQDIQEVMPLIKCCIKMGENPTKLDTQALEPILKLLGKQEKFKDLVASGQEFANQLNTPQQPRTQTSTFSTSVQPVTEQPSPLRTITEALSKPASQVSESSSKATKVEAKKAAETCKEIAKENVVSPENYNKLDNSVKKLEKIPDPNASKLAKIGGLVLGGLFLVAIAAPIIAAAVCTEGRALEGALDVGARIASFAVEMCDPVPCITTNFKNDLQSTKAALKEIAPEKNKVEENTTDQTPKLG